MLCLFCGKCCQMSHPKAYDDSESGCQKLRKIGTFYFCRSYSDRPYCCVSNMYQPGPGTYCVLGMKLLGIKNDTKASERREEGLKLIAELYGEKYESRCNERCKPNK